MRLVSASTVFGLLAVSTIPAHAQTGSASWYALDGNRTANGETMNSSKMTAAHPSLPFGTKIKVTNQRNGKSVVVRINDRGPFAKNRVLDVSKGAARQLGFVGRGHTTVKIARVDGATPVGAAVRYAKLDTKDVASPKQRPANALAALLTAGSVRGTPPPVADPDRQRDDATGTARKAGKGTAEVAFRPLKLNPTLAAVFSPSKRGRGNSEPGT